MMRKSALVLAVMVTFVFGLNIIRERFFLSDSTNVPQLLSEVGKIIDLPADESPTVATVTDPKELKGTLFDDSKVGDKLIFYSGTAQAILYRPSERKIIAVGSLTIQNK
jgi:hypothetical protein